MLRLLRSYFTMLGLEDLILSNRLFLKNTGNSKLNHLVLLLLSLLLACADTQDTMRVSSWVSSPEETHLFESTLDSFRLTHQEVQFDFEPIPGNYSEKLQLMLGTRTSPDLFFIKGYLAPSYMSFKILEPLDSYIEEKIDFELDDFFPSLIQSFQYEGVQYGLPKDFAPYVLFYNEEMFAAAGLDSLPTTWEELYKYAETLTLDLDHDGESDQYGLVIEPTTEMLMPFVFQNAGHFQKPDGTLGITDEPFVEALQFYHGLYTDGVATIPTDVGQGWNGDAFGRGIAAMCYSGGWLIPFLEHNYPDLKWKVAELPRGKEQATIAFTTAFAMPEASAFKDEAWAMMSYLTGKEGMRIWTSQGLALPSRKSVAKANGFYDHPVWGVFMESAAYARPFQIQFSERGFEEMVVAMQAIFYTGADPYTAMNDIKGRIERYKLK